MQTLRVRGVVYRCASDRPRFRLAARIAVLLAPLVAAACGGGSPMAPSAPTPGGTAGATVTGTVRSGAATLAVNTGAPGQGVKVSVVGTGIESGLDGTGRFSLTGVPSGDVTLRFSGAGVDATLPLSHVGSSEAIELTVHLAGSFATLEAERRSGGGAVEIEGRVESLPPTMAAGSFMVSGASVRTDGATRIEKGGEMRPFSDLEVGLRVHVTATATGADFLARTVTIQNTTTSVPVTVNGVIDSLSGDAAAFSFKIGSRVIHGDVLTEFFGNGEGDSFADLTDGDRVEVKGQQRDGYVYAARLHLNVSDEIDSGGETDAGGGQESSASIHGVLTSIGGAGTALTLMVGTTAVTTTAGTVVQRRGDRQTLSVLQVGMSLHVVGDRQSDGSLIGRSIHIEDDAVGGQVEIEGSAGGVKGTCPALTFTVNGYDLRTSAATTFTGLTCGGLKSGNKVIVNGIKEADGRILADTVKPS